jgi:transposase-like protein
MANVSRAWRKVKVDRDAWAARSLADEDIVRLILDGTVIRTRLDRKATNISVLAAIGVRRDGHKVRLSIRNMGGESTSSASDRPTGAIRPALPDQPRPWRLFLDDLDARGLKRPEFVIVDGAPGLEAALTALWGEELAIQRCTVHKHRNLLGHAPKHMQDELTEDYRDMIYADTAAEIETRRKTFLRKWRLKCIRHCRSDQWRANGSSSPTASRVKGDRGRSAAAQAP